MVHVRAGVVTTLVAMVSTSVLVTVLPSSSAVGGENGWGNREPVAGTTHAVLLEDGTTVLFSVGGTKDQTIFERRRTLEGVLGDRTVVARSNNGRYCGVTAVDAQLSTIAVGAQCSTVADFEDPPRFALELIWTASSGWSRTRHPRSDVNSVDVSPSAEHVVFATESEYFGTPQHVTTWSEAAGFEDHPRKERGLWGDSLVAGIGDDGRLVVLRTGGFEDEPGYWGGGVLSLLRLDPATGVWVKGFSRAYRHEGLAGMDLDVDAEGGVLASYLRYRSINRPEQPDTTAWLLRKQPGAGVSRSKVAGPDPDVLALRSGVTADGVGFAAWQQADGKTVVSRYTNWLPRKSQPHDAVAFDKAHVAPGTSAGKGLDLAVNSTGHAVLAWVSSHRDRTTANAVSFDARETMLTAGGSAWRADRKATVQAAAGSGGQSAALVGVWREFRPGRDASLVFRP